MSEQIIPKISKLHHQAYRCRDAEQTVWFWQDIMGLELSAALAFKEHSGVGGAREYMHLFFNIGDGSLLAFFDEPETATEGIFDKKDGFDVHIAFKTDTREEMMAFKDKIEAAKISVMGPFDHGFCESIYIYDPNGVQAEVAWNKPVYNAIMSGAGGDVAQQSVKDWCVKTREAKERLFGLEAIEKRGRS